MNRLLYILLLLTFLASCSDEKKRIENEKNIIGDWIRVDPHNDGGEMSSEFYDLDAMGFSFYSNETYENKAGFFRYITDDVYEKRVYLRADSKFRLTADSLYLFRPDNNKWHAYKIIKLTPDLLKFGTDEMARAFKRISAQKFKTPAFDKIILSTSDCAGPCPIMNIAIDKSGEVVFKGVRFTSKEGLFESSVSKEDYKKLQDNFRKMDFDSLKDSYDNGVSDGQTVTTTFVKNGEIYKTVYDYDRISPFLFKWSYLPLEYLYEKIPLNKITYPAFMKGFESTTDLKLIKGDSILQLKQSETFFLSELLRNAEIVNQNFKPRFNLRRHFMVQPFSTIKTDGRYYTFTEKGKQTTVDIGFNFYDVNAKIWQWRKANEYD